MDTVVVLHQRPRKKELEQIAITVVSKHPDAQTDVIDGIVVGSDTPFFLSQLVSRAENMNRSTSLSSVRRKRTSVGNEEETDKNSRPLRAIDAYGCVNWKPELPEGESEETQQQYKEALRQMFARSQFDADDVKRLCSVILSSEAGHE
jgi:hypothetical protein